MLDKFKINKEEIEYQIKKLSKSRGTIGVISIVIAFILTFIVSPAINKSISSTKEVIRFTKDINKGQMIDDSMIEIVTIGGFNTSNIISNKNEIINKYARIDIAKNTFAISNVLTDKNIKNYIYEINGMDRAISFTTEKLSNSVSSKIEAGDIISIIKVSKNQNNAESEILPELKYVEVIATTMEDGIDYNTNNNFDGLIKTITVKCSEEQAILIAGLEQSSIIHLSIVYRAGNNEIKEYLLSKQKAIIESIYNNRNYEEEEFIKQLLEPKKEEKNTNNFENILRIRKSSISQIKED